MGWRRASFDQSASGPLWGSLGCLVGLQGVLGGLLGRPWSKLSRTRNSSFHRGKISSRRQRGRLLAPNRPSEGPPKTQKCTKSNKAAKQLNLYKKMCFLKIVLSLACRATFLWLKIAARTQTRQILHLFRNRTFFDALACASVSR